jgi:hypothetical protein
MKRLITQHWRGEYPLVFSYWIIGVLLNAILYLTLTATSFLINKYAPTLTYDAWSLVVILVLLWIIGIWIYVGIWKSATRYSVEKKSYIWSGLAKFIVVCGVLQLSSISISQYAPSIKVMSGFLLGKDPIGKISLELLDQNKTLKIAGFFGNGSYSSIKTHLEKNPTVTKLYLNSNGGRFKEIENIARLVQEKKLSTYVESHCLSFCTAIFLAGYPRYATPTAKIGFHAPSFDGLEHLVEQFGLLDDSVSLYKSFNLPKKFVDKIFSTPNSTMWYPTYQELLSFGVVSEISLGGESNAIGSMLGRSKEDVIKKLQSTALFKKYDNKFPGFIESAAIKVMPLIQSGRPDSEVFSVIRAIAIPLQHKAIANSNPKIRGEFAELAKEQSIEISKYGPKACVDFLSGTLTVTSVLPKEMIAREMKLLEEALDASFVAPVYTDELYVKLIEIVTAKMSSQELATLNDPTVDAGQVVCTALVNFYTGVMNLTAAQRDTVIFGMLK